MSLHNALQCKVAYDECVRTGKYKHGGQNIYETCTNSRKPIYSSDITQNGVHSWINEYHNISDIAIEHIVDDDAIAKFGRYLQVVKNNADRIGCSLVQYQGAENSVCTLLVCNYNVGVMNDHPTYQIGPYTSKCSTGSSHTYPGLCNEEEDFTKHKHADVFFTNNSPVVAKWVKEFKRINTGGTVISYFNNTEKIYFKPKA